MKTCTVFSPLVLLCLLSMFQGTLCAAENISEWHLPEGAIARLGKGPVNQIAYSPDGKHLAVISDIGVWIYDASTGTEQALLTKDTGRAVSKVGFSPDGQTLAVTGDRQELQLWDTRTWTLNGTFDKDGNWPTDFAFSPDGNTIAAADLGQETELWDVSTIRFRCLLEDSADPFSEGTGFFTLAFSPNGDTVAIGSDDGTVRLWEPSTGTLKHTFTGSVTSTESFAFTPDGRTLATRSFANTVWLWDTTTGRLIQTLDGIGNDLGDSIAYSPDGEMLAILGWGGLQLWDTETDEHKQTLEESEEIESFAFSPDGRTIAGLCAQQRKVWYDDGKTRYTTNSTYHTVSLWDPATLQHKSTLETTDSVESFAFHPDGNTIATMNADNTVQVWDVGTGELTYTLEHTGGIVGISYNLERPDTFITAHKDKMTRVWDTGTQTRKHTFRLTEHTDALNSAAFSPDGRTLATASLDGSVQLWDATTGILKETLIGRKYTGGDLYPSVGPFSPDGETVVVNLGRAVQLLGAAPARVKRMIRTRKYTKDANLGVNFWVRSIAYSPDGNTIATGMDESTVMLWDTRTEEHKHTFEHFSEYDSTVHGVAFSPDGRTLATADTSKILLSDTSTWTLKPHTYDIDYCQLYYEDISIALVYSPDGKTLAHGCNGTVLWDPLTGTLKNRLAGHAGTVTSITYHPDGNILATAGQDGTVLLWDLTSHHLNPPKEE